MKMHCRICGNKSKDRVCKRCNYFLKHGATEEAIKNMLSDTKTQKIWDENKKVSKNLADVYYESTIDNYKIPKGTTKEDFGYNTFSDGINLGLDIVMPMMDKKDRRIVKEKINSMINIRRKNKKR